MSTSEGSPGWKKPSHVMKVRLKKQRKSTSDFSSRDSLSDQSQAQLTSSTKPSSSDSRRGKRRNPFGSGGGNVVRRRVQSESVGRRTLDEKENGDDISHHKLFTALDSQQDEVFSDEAGQQLTETIESLKEEQTDARSQKKAENKRDDPLLCGRPTMAADWCLRTRLRFTSRSSFSWCQPMRMMEEAKGLCNFVRGTQKKNEDVQSGMESRWRSELQQSTMCWMHPSLPWLSLFPRIRPEPKVFKQSVATKDPALAGILMASWSESFRSVYHLLRSGHCPYFYLCTHQFTVLFRGTGVAGQPAIHALLTPTTRGLREALKTEGISFSMPLHVDTATHSDEAKRSKVMQEDDTMKSEPSMSEVDDAVTAPSDDTRDDDNGDDDDDDAEEDILRSPTKASSWLQSMGLDKMDFPSLQPNRVKFQTDYLLKLDSRPQSLVVVEGADTQALYNFLLNSRTVITSVGPLADIPPTILSPVAFKGATLNSCKVKSGTIRKQNKGSALEEVSSLEVTGPIMPHNIHDLCTLLRTTQDEGFHVVCSNHEPTSAFTSCSRLQAENGDGVSVHESAQRTMQTNCGLSESISEYLTSPCDANASLKEITCRDDLYFW